MRPDAHTLKDVQVVAFGTQKKESVVSSITSIRPGDLKTSSSDLTTSFAGRIPGMAAWQTGGMPGAMTESEMNTKFYVRGITSFQSGANTDPLILIDGVESTKLDLARLTVEDIETFNVMKDASATAMYGARGANGVILVTTKKGEEGTVYTSVRYEAIMSEPTKEICRQPHRLHALLRPGTARRQHKCHAEVFSGAHRHDGQRQISFLGLSCQ